MTFLAGRRVSIVARVGDVHGFSSGYATLLGRLLRERNEAERSSERRPKPFAELRTGHTTRGWRRPANG